MSTHGQVGIIVDYEQWIERERRLRIKILKSSYLITQENIYRVCHDCEEVCLCHEDICPNCNSGNVVNQVISHESPVEGRIRCRYRFSKLVGE